MGGAEGLSPGVWVPERALAAGFSNSPIGTHTGKTMMLPEIRLLLNAVPVDADFGEYRRAAVLENALGKSTSANRSNTLMYLKQLYALRGDVPVFAAMRELWSARHDDQPTLAVLCAAARDVLLRATASHVVALPVGAVLLASDLSSEIERQFPHRYSAATLKNLGSNIAASWTQAGLLAGHREKHRASRPVDVAAVVYALYLGHLEGLAGPSLFASRWVQMLDESEAGMRAHAEQASRKGWLEYRSSGGMTEITFRHLDALTGWATH